jgi:hypothetical protein
MHALEDLRATARSSLSFSGDGNSKPARASAIYEQVSQGFESDVRVATHLENRQLLPCCRKIVPVVRLLQGMELSGEFLVWHDGKGCVERWRM